MHNPVRLELQTFKHFSQLVLKMSLWKGTHLFVRSSPSVRHHGQTVQFHGARAHCCPLLLPLPPHPKAPLPIFEVLS